MRKYKRTNAEEAKEEFLSYGFEMVGDYVGRVDRNQDIIHIRCGNQGKIRLDSLRSGQLTIGCYECGLKRQVGKRTGNKGEFIKKAEAVHGQRYDYSKVKYVNRHVKIEIICEEHGSWIQSPNSHLRGSGCKPCGYISNREKQRTPNKGASLRDKFPELCKEWDYDRNEMVPSEVSAGADYRAYWTCQNCENEWQTYMYCRTGSKKSGCPVCKKSKGELIIVGFLNDLNLNFISQFTFPGCRGIKYPLRFDFAILDKFNNVKLLVEYQGEQHFRPVEHFGGEEGFERLVELDEVKRDFCESTGIRLLEIPYWDKEVIKETIERVLNEI